MKEYVVRGLSARGEMELVVMADSEEGAEAEGRSYGMMVRSAKEIPTPEPGEPRRFFFQAMSATGEELSNVVTATSEEEAKAIVRQQGYFITRIEEDVERLGHPTRVPLTFGLKDMLSAAIFSFMLGLLTAWGLLSAFGDQ